jgi:hypothetical protein
MHESLLRAYFGALRVPHGDQISRESQKTVRVDSGCGVDVAAGIGQPRFDGTHAFEQRFPSRFQLAGDVALVRINRAVPPLGYVSIISCLLTSSSCAAALTPSTLQPAAKDRYDAPRRTDTPVKVSPNCGLEPATAHGIVIHVANLQVHVETGTDVAYVAALTEALRSRC